MGMKITTTGCPLLLLLLFGLGTTVNGHGYLIEPPARSSAWRAGFNTPINYNDNQLYCGGFDVQYKKNNGSCGFCGDEYSLVNKTQEAGGPYDTNTTVRNYTVGQVITAKVTITTAHKGFFEFQLCDTRSNNLTETCVKGKPYLYLLEQPNGATQFTNGNEGITKENKNYTVQLVLPKALTCSKCVLQWRYHAGNNWGDCGNGTGALGCGDQEEFYGCADISISASAPAVAVSVRTSQTSNTTRNRAQAEDNEMNCRSTGRYGATDDWCQRQCAVGFCPQTHCMCDSDGTTTTETTTTDTTTTATTSAYPTTYAREMTSEWETTTLEATYWPEASLPEEEIAPQSRCRGTPLFGVSDEWCETNCALGYCPSSHCTCDSDGETTETTTETTTTDTTTTATTSAYPTTYAQEMTSEWETTSLEATFWPEATSPEEELAPQSRCRGTLLFGASDEWCQTNCAVGYCPPSHCICDSDGETMTTTEYITTTGMESAEATTSAVETTSSEATTSAEATMSAEETTSEEEIAPLIWCRAAGQWAGISSVDHWCNINCNRHRPFCPASHCICN